MTMKVFHMIIMNIKKLCQYDRTPANHEIKEKREILMSAKCRVATVQARIPAGNQCLVLSVQALDLNVVGVVPVLSILIQVRPVQARQRVAVPHGVTYQKTISGLIVISFVTPQLVNRR